MSLKIKILLTEASLALALWLQDQVNNLATDLEKRAMELKGHGLRG
jgi:hypothetical protein